MSYYVGAAMGLVGAGMQAAGMTIPVGPASANLIEGMRNYGLPVPPRNFFSYPSQYVNTTPAHAASTTSIYQPTVSPYYSNAAPAPRHPSYGNTAIATRTPVYPIPTCTYAYPSSHCHNPYHQPPINSTAPQWSAPYASTSTTTAYPPYPVCHHHHQQEPIGQQTNVLEKVDKSARIKRERENAKRVSVGRANRVPQNMPRKTRNSNRTVMSTRQPSPPPQLELIETEPDEIIDLTHDSPTNEALRRKRQHQGRVERTDESSNAEHVTVLDDADESSEAKKPKKPAPVIDLEDTIVLDDSEKAMLSDEDQPSLSCPICLENFITGSNIKPMTTPCGHVFCSECLEKISETNKKCSICQRPLTFRKCIRLHI